MAKWVRRNSDKPHRCPQCHGVATWDYETDEFRWRLDCDKCRVRWLYMRRV